MSNGIFNVPAPRNEPVLAYTPGSPERKALRAELDRMGGQVIEIAPRIGGRRITTGRTAEAVMPHDHRHVLAVWHKAGASEVQRAIDAAGAAHREWSRLALSRPRGDLSQGRRSPRGAVPHDLERRDDARPVQDGAPGRDRRGMRADRLLALQRRLRGGDLSPAAAVVARRAGTGSSTVRSKGSCSRSRRSTSRRSAATCRRRPPSWATPSCGSRRRPRSTPPTSSWRSSRRRACRPASSTWCRARAPTSVTRRWPRRRSRASTSPDRPRRSRGCGRRSDGTSAATGPIRGSSARPAARISSSLTRRPTWRRS